MKETKTGCNSIRGENVWIFQESQTECRRKNWKVCYTCSRVNWIKINKSQIVASHRLGKSERTIVKFLNRKDAENVLANKKKFRDIDISKIVTHDTEVSSDHFPEVQNGCMNIFSNPTKRKKLFISQNLSPFYRYLYGLVEEKETEGLITDLWVSVALSV